MSGNPNSLSSIDMQDILQRLMTASGSDGSQTPVERMQELMSMMKSLGMPGPPAQIAQLEAMLSTQEGRARLNNNSGLMNVMASGAEEIRGVLEDAMEKKKSSSGKARVDRLLQGLKLKALKDLARDNNVDLKGLREKREVGRGVDVAPGRARGTDVLASRSRRRSRPRAFTRRRTLELLLKGT